MSLGNKPKVIVVMPAFNVAKALKQTVDDQPLDEISGVILVDDGSKDDTVQIAKMCGANGVWPPSV